MKNYLLKNRSLGSLSLTNNTGRMVMFSPGEAKACTPDMLRFDGRYLENLGECDEAGVITKVTPVVTAPVVTPVVKTPVVNTAPVVSPAPVVIPMAEVATVSLPVEAPAIKENLITEAAPVVHKKRGRKPKNRPDIEASPF